MLARPVGYIKYFYAKQIGNFRMEKNFSEIACHYGAINKMPREEKHLYMEFELIDLNEDHYSQSECHEHMSN